MFIYFAAPVSLSAQVGRCPGSQKVRYHTALIGEIIPTEGHPEIPEPSFEVGQCPQQDNPQVILILSENSDQKPPNPEHSETFTKSLSEVSQRDQLRVMRILGKMSVQKPPIVLTLQLLILETSVLYTVCL